jgi:hypothetical protein
MSEAKAEAEYDRALHAVVSAAAECRRSRGEEADPLADALTILHGVIRVSFPGSHHGNAIAERMCMSVVVGAISQHGVGAVDEFNTALEADGLPWQLVPLTC